MAAALRMQRSQSESSMHNDSLDADRLIPLEVTRDLPFTSVVKIFVISARPNYAMPWQMQRQEACTGSGFVLEGNRILTNAHVVRDFTTVRVRRHGGSDKWEAKVLCINHGCDLALLTVEDPLFWSNLPPLIISPQLPNLYENVMVIGFPMGGDNICVTRGVVSRVTTINYETKVFDQPVPELLTIQIDAAINSGNSGGPVIHENGYVVGVAFSGYAGSADNIGYIIPQPVIRNFIHDFETHGYSNAIVDFGFSYMLCENPTLREKFGLKPPNSGVLVTRVTPLGAARRAGIAENDIITHIAGQQIANDGTVFFRKEERLDMRHLITTHPCGASCDVRVLRDGKSVKFFVEGMATPLLVPRHRESGTMPTYLVVGGVIFTPLSCGLLDSVIESISEEAWAAGREPKMFPDQEVVVILSVLSHPINHGYEMHRLAKLQSCNGIDVKNVRHIKEIVDQVPEDGFIHFKTATGKSLIFSAKQCRETEHDILSTYAVPAACSSDFSAPPTKADAKAKVAEGKKEVKKPEKASAKNGKKGKKAADEVLEEVPEKEEAPVAKSTPQPPKKKGKRT